MQREAPAARVFALACLLSAVCLFPTPASRPASAQDLPTGQERAPEPTDPSSAMMSTSVTRTLLESKIKEVASALDLSDEARAKLTDYYRQALSSLEQTRSYDDKTTAYARSLETAPGETRETERRITDLRTKIAEKQEPLAPGIDLQEIEQQLVKEQADAAAVDAKFSEMDKELEVWSRRPGIARERISEAKIALDELDIESARPPPSDEPRSLAEAHRWLFETRQRELRAEILMRDQELLTHAVREELLRAHRDKAELDLKIIEARKRFLEQQLNQRRLAEAQRARSETETATREAAGKHFLVQDLADRNATLTDELSSATAALDRMDEQLATVANDAKHIAEEYRSARQRLAISGLTQAMGAVLLDRRQQLPEQRTYLRAAKEREGVIAQANLRQIRYNEERLRLRDLDNYLDTLLADIPEHEITAGLRGELRALLERRKTLLDRTQSMDDTYLRSLGELDYRSNQLLTVVASYDDFLAERLLWVRSAAPAGPSSILGLPRALVWLLSPTNWLEVARVLRYEASASPLLWLLILLVIGLLWKTRVMRQGILDTAEHLRRVRTDRFRYTLQALGLTALLAAPWPLLIATLGWQLAASVEATAFTKPVGIAAITISMGLFSLRGFSLLCKTGGVADRHFHWSERVRTLIRRNFLWAIWGLVPPAFVASIVYDFRDPAYEDSLGRTTLVLVMIGLAAFTARLIHPGSGLLQNIIQENPQGWLHRLQKVWYPLLVAVPLALVVLTLAGYTYTAGTLLESLVSELWLALGLTILHQSIVRWLMLTSRRLTLQAVLDRVAMGSREESKQAAPEAGSPLQIEEPEVDLASLDGQTRRLINSAVFVGALLGLWAIWSDVLPAFGVFDKVALWHYSGMVDSETVEIPVTLGNIGLILVIAVLATIAARNLPALLEILLLQRTSVSSGSRYAVKVLTGYVIAATAALVIFSTLGLSWAQVQWLVAALGVGIGFGLQEIVANFISGIIILFERPVRVGDIVTIGDTSGVVTQIRIRATTIRNWDKKELLVPNKEFITGRLLNWTLSDTINRIVITVGVAYGSDVGRALELLEQAVREDQRILEEPSPLFTFEGFGDNTLDLVLRCYLDGLDHRLSVISALHQAINRKFQDAGISIAFPQRDIHLSSAQPLDVRVHQAWPEARERAAGCNAVPGEGGTPGAGPDPA